MFDDQASAKHFGELRAYVGGLGSPKAARGERTPPTFVSDDAGLFDFACAARGEFVSTYAIFEKGRFSPYLLSKKSFRVSVGDRLDEKTFVSKLLSFLYAFQEYCADPWTYRREGDSVTVRTSRERVIVSFFDSEVDAVSVAPLEGGKPASVGTFVFPDRNPGNRFSDAPSQVDAAIADGALTFFHDPDFAPNFPEIRNSLTSCVTFWGIAHGEAEDL